LARTVSSDGLRARAGRLLAQAALVTLFATFAVVNFNHWRSTGRPSGLGTTVLEGWAAALFLVRRPPREVSTSGLAWIAAPVGSFAMLLARPHGGGLSPWLCEGVQVAGLMLAVVSLGVLGRSFGLVAANRGVKTRGPYGFVRHPAYAGYLLTYTGYVAENPSARNIGLYCLVAVFQLVRIREEEQLLSGDSVYARYRSRVRYRVIPLVY
jgi:protein-S-isoprenylcysteine O-methyltransferase Ste14